MNRVEAYSKCGFAKLLVLFATLFFVSITGAYADAPVNLREGTGRYEIGKNLSFLEDKTGLLTLDDVMTGKRASSFIKSTSDVPNFSFTKSDAELFDHRNVGSSDSRYTGN